MGLTSGKRVIKEFNEVRCSLVEKEISMERVKYLKKLLEHNGFEVMFGEDPPKPPDAETGKTLPVTYSIGVTDVTFNPVIKVYNRELKTFDGHKVTADYWNQKTQDTEPNYWDIKKKDWLKDNQ